MSPDLIPGYHQRLRSPAAALRALAGRGNPEVLQNSRDAPDPTAARIEAWNRLVFESLAHGDPPPVTPRQNWLVATLGAFLPNLRLTQDPRKLLMGGKGLCSEAVIVLLALCRRDGLEAQMLDLSGHVVARVRADGREWIADPDFGIVYLGPLETLTQPPGLARVRSAVLTAGHDTARADEVVRILEATKGEVVVARGVLSPRLASVERALDLIAWMLPLALALAGLAWLLFRR